MTDRWTTARIAAVSAGGNLRWVRGRLKMTLSALAFVLETQWDAGTVSSPDLSRIENGSLLPSVRCGVALDRWTQHALGTLQRTETAATGTGGTVGQATLFVTSHGDTAAHAQPAQMRIPDRPHARRSDPTSSHLTVASIAADRTLAGLIMQVGARLGRFDDTDLTAGIETVTGRRHQRNVIARARGLLEPSGQIVRLGPVHRDDRRVPTIHFTIGDTE